MKKLDIDVVDTLFDAVLDLNILPDSTPECTAAMGKVHGLLDFDTFNELEMSVNMRVNYAMQAAFRAGWQIRGQV